MFFSRINNDPDKPLMQQFRNSQNKPMKCYISSLTTKIPFVYMTKLTEQWMSSQTISWVLDIRFLIVQKFNFLLCFLCLWELTLTQANLWWNNSINNKETFGVLNSVNTCPGIVLALASIIYFGLQVIGFIRTEERNREKTNNKYTLNSEAQEHQKSYYVLLSNNCT